MASLKEEFGIWTAQNNAVMQTYMGLFALQHRGQESCGIAVNSRGVISLHKNVGLVREVFDRQTIESMGEGRMAIGHTRYSTAGTVNHANAQPLAVNHMKGQLAIAHNGNLTNAAELRRELEMKGAIFHTTNDSEIIAYVIIQERLASKTIEEAVAKAAKRLKGAYSLVIMSPEKLIAMRDEHGFRPLVMGKKENGDIIFCSETCALYALGASYVKDLDAGEIVVVSKGKVRSIPPEQPSQKHLCIFEFIYFARPDSVIEGMSVHEARIRAGRMLARSDKVDADVVIGVPDSGIDAALGYSMESGIPYEIGFVRNRYIARTFIEPTQDERESSVNMKLSVIESAVRGKSVIMVDDSIVRGTTSARIVSQLKEAGARQVHVRISSPPFVSPCYFGTDIDSRENLIAVRMSEKEIAEYIGADSLAYMDPGTITEIAKGASCSFCTGCFTSVYPAEVPKTDQKMKFEIHLPE